jgi:hypothetical protein
MDHRLNTRNFEKYIDGSVEPIGNVALLPQDDTTISSQDLENLLTASEILHNWKDLSCGKGLDEEAYEEIMLNNVNTIAEMDEKCSTSNEDEDRREETTEFSNLTYQAARFKLQILNSQGNGITDEVLAILDTGASSSLISRKFAAQVSKCKIKSRKNSRILQLGNGSTCYAQIEMLLRVRIGKAKLALWFGVLDDLPTDLLIGNDAIHRLG